MCASTSLIENHVCDPIPSIIMYRLQIDAHLLKAIVTIWHDMKCRGVEIMLL